VFLLSPRIIYIFYDRGSGVVNQFYDIVLPVTNVIILIVVLDRNDIDRRIVTETQGDGSSVFSFDCIKLSIYTARTVPAVSTLILCQLNRPRCVPLVCGSFADAGEKLPGFRFPDLQHQRIARNAVRNEQPAVDLQRRRAAAVKDLVGKR